jgi:hypothetical protein
MCTVRNQARHPSHVPRPASSTGEGSTTLVERPPDPSLSTPGCQCRYSCGPGARVIRALESSRRGHRVRPAQARWSWHGAVAEGGYLSPELCTALQASRTACQSTWICAYEYYSQLFCTIFVRYCHILLCTICNLHCRRSTYNIVNDIVIHYNIVNDILITVSYDVDRMDFLL